MGRYRRTVSFPNPNPNQKPTSRSLHVRSASLPCARSNPLIPQLRDQVNELRTWDRASVGSRIGSNRTCDGLGRLKSVLHSLDDVLQLPITQDSLSTSTPMVEKLLENFLRFVDVYGIFQSSLLCLKQEVSSAQVAIRRKDIPKLGIHVKAQNKIANQISKLVKSIAGADEPPPTTANPAVDDEEELRWVIMHVHRLTVSVTSAVLAGVSGSFGTGRRWVGLGLARRGRREEEGIEEFEKVVEGVENLMMGLRKKGGCDDHDEMMKMEELRRGVLRSMEEMEDCIGEMEKGSEKVFRSLISTRVSLLNILTHA